MRPILRARGVIGQVMESFIVATELRLNDWLAYRRAAIARNRAAVPRWPTLLVAAIASVTTYLLLTTHDGSSTALVGGVFLGIALLYLVSRSRAKQSEAAQRNAFLGPCRYEFSAGRFHSSGKGIESSIQWTRIREVTCEGDHLFLWLHHPAAFVLPLRDLPSDVPREEAIARIRGWIATAGSAERPADETTNLASSSAMRSAGMQGPTPTLGRTLLRLLVLQRTDGTAISGSDRSIFLLGLISLVFWAAIDRLGVGEDAELYFYNLPSLTLIAVVVLLIAWWFARRSNPRIEYRKALVVAAAFLPLVVVVNALIAYFVPPQSSAFATFLLLVYAVAYAANALWALTGTRQPLAAVGGVAMCAVLWTVTASVTYLDTGLWYDPEPSNEQMDQWRSSREQTESLLFDQRRRIDDAVGAIKRPRNTPTATFFVGFAGVGEEKVFAEEIKLADKVVGERYGSQQTSLLLINDQRDLDGFPLATKTGLHYALTQVAKKMDLDHDILFLALSSHGSDQPEISVSNNALPLTDLDGEALAAALDDSHIKWRVIVISACHAGAFIPYLMNPNTIVLTAAAAEKTSFGCSNDRDLTYFGEALYRDALPHSQSLVEAFEQAKIAIAKRERAEGRTPSDPQAFVGEAIRLALAAHEPINVRQ